MTPAWNRLAALVARYAGDGADPGSRSAAASAAAGDWIQILSALSLACDAFQAGSPPSRADAAFLWGTRCAFGEIRFALEAALLFLGIENPSGTPP